MPRPWHPVVGRARYAGQQASALAAQNKGLDLIMGDSFLEELAENRPVHASALLVPSETRHRVQVQLIDDLLVGLADHRSEYVRHQGLGGEKPIPGAFHISFLDDRLAGPADTRDNRKLKDHLE